MYKLLSRKMAMSELSTGNCKREKLLMQVKTVPFSSLPTLLKLAVNIKGFVGNSDNENQPMAFSSVLDPG